MIIKELKIEDFLINKAIISELLIETYVSEFDISEELSTSLCDEKLSLIPDYINQNNAILLGAYEDDILTGFLWIYKRNYFGELRLHINQIVVAQQFRGNGIGNQLMKEAEKTAEKYGIYIIDLFVSETNLKAINMYESIGFTAERRYMKKLL